MDWLQVRSKAGKEPGLVIAGEHQPGFTTSTGMKNCVCMALLMMVLATGCGKNGDAAKASASPLPDQPTASATPSTTPGPPLAAPVAVPANPAVVVVPEGGGMNATAGQLTRQLRRYISRNHSTPSSFEDFVASAHLQVPPPPPGKKFAISSNLKVVLVNR